MYGDGDYFAKDPNVAFKYSRTGSFVFMCHLHFLENEQQQKWVEEKGYYVMNMANQTGDSTRMQVLPVQLIQFQPFVPITDEELILDEALKATKDGSSQRGCLQESQWGAAQPHIITTKAWFPNEPVSHFHFGWLNPTYSKERLIQSVKNHFRKAGLIAIEVVVDKNGLRQGAYVKLSASISPSVFRSVAALKYVFSLKSLFH